MYPDPLCLQLLLDLYHAALPLLPPDTAGKQIPFFPYIAQKNSGIYLFRSQNSVLLPSAATNTESVPERVSEVPGKVFDRILSNYQKLDNNAASSFHLPMEEA